MMRSLTGTNIPAGAETGIWNLLAFLADQDGCAARMAELAAIRDEIHGREEALAKGQAGLAEAQAALDADRTTLANGYLEFHTRREAFEAGAAEARAALNADRDQLERDRSALSSDRAAFDKEKVAEIGARGERATAMRLQDDEIKARAVAVADREAAASKALAEAEALKAEHERLVENAKKLLAGG